MAFKAEQQNISYRQTFANYSQHETLLGVIETAKKGNALLREWFAKVEAGEDVGAQKKGGDFEHFGFDDVFTQADLESQKLVISELKSIVDIPIEAEEEDEHRCDMVALPTGSQRWLIDPIDGTFCFKQGIPDFSITIALQTKQADGSWKTEIGCVSDPMSDEVFIADDSGAHLIKGEREKTLSLPQPESHDFTSVKDCLKQNPKIELVLFSRQNKVFEKLRETLHEQFEEMGVGTLTFSTALFLSRLADNWYDGAIIAADGLEFDWDTKAALHIAENAGAKIEHYELGGEPVCLVAKNSALLQALKQTVSESYQALLHERGAVLVDLSDEEVA